MCIEYMLGTVPRVLYFFYTFNPPNNFVKFVFSSFAYLPFIDEAWDNTSTSQNQDLNSVS